MQFQVPQFIEVEDKIFGQLTLKQFIYLAGGAGLSFIIYRMLSSFLFAVFPDHRSHGLSAAFWPSIKYNNKPFIYVVEAAFKYFFSNKLYIWKKEDRAVQKTQTAEKKRLQQFASVMVPKISDSKLKDLTWSLDIKESMYTNKINDNGNSTKHQKPHRNSFRSEKSGTALSY
jgi:hypothetical protein